ncbi:MAG: DUF2271 domain-containing protein [Akkermansiaceae bacterium]|nr:DUF2271 domain-containing protein [Akkermansiaceae bacterium]
MKSTARLIPFILFACSAARVTATELFRFHHENILGTSLDLEIAAESSPQASTVETATLAEIERLRKILSGYDATSELGQLNSATTPIPCSTELLDVLGAYENWQKRSSGAYSGHVGELTQLWAKAEKSGVIPTTSALAPVLTALAADGWRPDLTNHTVTRLSPPQSLNLNSLGKGYIVTKASIAARKAAPGVTGMLVNIGGDIFASGNPSAETPWEIRVADPKHSEDNAPPLTKVRLVDQAVSTSAAYERGYTVAGKRYSHILDPRTGYPANGAASATVVAKENATANALATTLCVLKPEEGLALVKSTPGAECLIVDADGKQWRSDRFAALEGTPAPRPIPPPITTIAASAGSWPAGFQVSIAIELILPETTKKRPKRPFVAVWVEDTSGKRVRNITVWGDERKYLKELRSWWAGVKEQPDTIASVTRATRSAGKYRIEWDGKDDQGQALPIGTYTITLEAKREHGTYSISHGPIECGKSPAKGTIPAGTEFGESPLNYGPPLP